jgi:signal peptidase I
MQKVVPINAKGDLDKKKDHHKSPWKVFWHIFWIVLFVAVISVSSQIIYDYSRYSSFFVNGDSMYPTLNKGAIRFKDGVSEGEESHHGNWGNYDSDTSYTYIVDYGLMDSSGDFLDNLERFDIIVTHFDSDYKNSSTSSTDMKADLKIKRLYGLPHESLYFDENGELFVKKESETSYQKIAQPQIIVDDGNLSKTADASSGTIYGTESNPAVLDEDEYFVVGDNRRYGASGDSRIDGPLGSKKTTTGKSGRDLIKGKAVAITGANSLYFDEKGTTQTKFAFDHLRMPWDIKYL